MLEANYAVEHEVKAAVDAYFKEHNKPYEPDFYANYVIYERNGFDLDGFVAWRQNDGRYGVMRQTIPGILRKLPDSSVRTA